MYAAKKRQLDKITEHNLPMAIFSNYPPPAPGPPIYHHDQSKILKLSPCSTPHSTKGMVELLFKSEYFYVHWIKLDLNWIKIKSNSILNYLKKYAID